MTSDFEDVHQVDAIQAPDALIERCGREPSSWSLWVCCSSLNLQPSELSSIAMKCAGPGC